MAQTTKCDRFLPLLFFIFCSTLYMYCYFWGWHQSRTSPHLPSCASPMLTAVLSKTAEAAGKLHVKSAHVQSYDKIELEIHKECGTRSPECTFAVGLSNPDIVTCATQPLWGLFSSQLGFREVSFDANAPSDSQVKEAQMIIWYKHSVNITFWWELWLRWQHMSTMNIS